MRISATPPPNSVTSSSAAPEGAAPAAAASGTQAASTPSLPSAAVLRARSQSTARQFETRFSGNAQEARPLQPKDNFIQRLPTELIERILSEVPNERSAKIQSLSETDHKMRQAALEKTQSKLLVMKLLEITSKFELLRATSSSNELFSTIVAAINNREASFKDFPDTAGAPAGKIKIHPDDIPGLVLSLIPCMGIFDNVREERFSLIVALVENLNMPEEKEKAIAALLEALGASSPQHRVTGLDRLTKMISQLASSPAKKEIVNSLARQILLLPGRGSSTFVDGISDAELKDAVNTALQNMAAPRTLSAYSALDRKGRERLTVGLV